MASQKIEKYRISNSVVIRTLRAYPTKRDRKQHRGEWKKNNIYIISHKKNFQYQIFNSIYFDSILIFRV